MDDIELTALQLTIRSLIVVLQGTPELAQLAEDIKTTALKAAAASEIQLSKRSGGFEVIAALHSELERLFGPSPSRRS